MKQSRLIWVDWMKVIAMFFIIWGHFFSDGCLYIYVFNVPVFCVISGFLYKKEEKWSVFFNKTLYNLFLPMVIMSFLMYIEKCIRTALLELPLDFQIYEYCKYMILGYHWTLGPCWYIYTLILMKLIMQFIPSKHWVYAVVFIISSISAILFRQLGIIDCNSYLNVFVAFPFFIMGVFFQKWKTVFNEKGSLLYEITFFLSSLILVCLCKHYNDGVWMYKASFGNRFDLFLLGGIAGTAMIFFVSKWASLLPYRKMIFTLSNGAIVMLGLHIIFVNRLCSIPNRTAIEDMFFSIFILLLFVPIIRITELLFPILLGKYRRK